MKACIVWEGDRSVGIPEAILEINLENFVDAQDLETPEYRKGIKDALKNLGEAICEERLYVVLGDECWDCGRPSCDGGCQKVLNHDEE